jgi:nucleoside-diphosphate-sugar epimerase
MSHVIIVGGEGYIGSELSNFLSAYHEVTSIDIGWFSRDNKRMLKIPVADPKTPYFVGDVKDVAFEQFVTPETIAIILLAGHSSVAMCRDKISDKKWTQSPAYKNNVDNFVYVLSQAEKLGIPLIYASSASVYGFATSVYSIETDAFWGIIDESTLLKKHPEFYDRTKRRIDWLASFDKKIPVIGLRFGTVNGCSPNLRTELMLNNMVKNAMETGEIIISQPELRRAILFMRDLCRAFELILMRLDKTIPEDKHIFTGVYNLGSINSTVMDLAENVKRDLSGIGPITIRKVEPEYKSPYNVWLKCDEFEKTFGKYKETSSNTVIYDLYAQYKGDLRVGAVFDTRNELKDYP